MTKLFFVLAATLFCSITSRTVAAGPQHRDPSLEDELRTVDSSACAQTTANASELQQMYRGTKAHPLDENEQAPSSCSQAVVKQYDDCATIPSGFFSLVEATGLRDSINKSVEDFRKIAAEANKKASICTGGRKKIESACESIAADLKQAINENSRAERFESTNSQTRLASSVYVDTRRKLEAQLQNSRQLETKAMATLGELAKCYLSKKQKAEIISQYEAGIGQSVGFDRSPGSIGAGPAAGVSDTSILDAAKSDAVQSGAKDAAKNAWGNMKPIPTPGYVIVEPENITPPSAAVEATTKSFAASAAPLLFGAVGDYFGMISPAGSPCDEAHTGTALDQNAKGCAAYAQSALDKLRAAKGSQASP